MSHHASGPNFGFPRGDARLDMIDLYAFLEPGDPAKSVIVLNVHPSFALSSPEPTTSEPFKPGALYEFKVETNGDAVADICYSVQFASFENGKQTATVRLAKAGCRPIAVEDPCKRFSFPARRERSTSAGSQRMMIPSSASSRTN